jgi:hypothetical protein
VTKTSVFKDVTSTEKVLPFILLNTISDPTTEADCISRPFRKMKLPSTSSHDKTEPLTMSGKGKVNGDAVCLNINLFCGI